MFSGEKKVLIAIELAFGARELAYVLRTKSANEGWYLSRNGGDKCQ